MRRWILFSILGVLIFPIFSSAATCVDLPRNLSRGSRGPDVSALQQFLKESAGYTGTISGNMGPLTMAALTKWQLSKGIIPNATAPGAGTTGPKTRAALACTKPIVTLPVSPSPTSALTITRTLAKGISGTDVVALQKFLISQGLLTTSATGYFGVQTEAAVVAYQKANALPQIGIVGPKTRAAIASGVTVRPPEPVVPRPPTTPSPPQPAPPTPPTPVSPLPQPPNPAEPSACILDGVKVAHGASRTFFPVSTVESGQTCAGQSRMCTNGVLSGSSANNKSFCSVGTSLACSWNGAAVLSGASVVAFQAASVPSGQTCQQQTRTCSGGTLSGTYTFPQCSVAPAVTLSADATTMRVGESTTIRVSYTAAPSDAITQTTLNIGAASVIPYAPATSRTYTFTPTAAGDTEFLAYAQTTKAPEWAVYKRLTVHVDAAPAPVFNSVPAYTNAADYGLSASASGDANAVSLQRAVDAAKYGRVVIPAGYYCIGKTVVLSADGAWLSGMGKQSTTLSACGTDTTLVSMTNRLELLTGLTLIGKGSNKDSGTFGATQSVVSVGPSCIDCFLMDLDIWGGAHEIANTSGEADFYQVNLHQPYGSAALYATGGGWMSFMQIGDDAPHTPSSATSWQPNTTYAVGDVVVQGSYYIAITKAGQSASTAPALRSYGIPMSDGSAQWQLIGPVDAYGVLLNTGAGGENYAHHVTVSGLEHAFGAVGTNSGYFRCSECVASKIFSNPLQFSDPGTVYLIDNMWTAGAKSAGAPTTQLRTATLAVPAPVHDIDPSLVLNALKAPTAATINATDYGLSQGASGEQNANALQKAVDAAGSGRVIIPAGSYCINKPIIVRSPGAWLSGTSFGGTGLNACGEDTTLVSMRNSGQMLTNLTLIGKGGGRDAGSFGTAKPVVDIQTSCDSCFAGLLWIVGGSNAIYNAGSHSRLFGIIAYQPYGSAMVYSVGDDAIVYRAKLDHNGAGIDPSATYPSTIGQWQPQRTYRVGDLVTLSGYYIIAAKAGVTGAAAPALRNYLMPINDGTVEWQLEAPIDSHQMQMDTGARGLYGTQIDMTGQTAHAFGMTNTRGGAAPTLFSCLDCITSQAFGSNVNLLAGSAAQFSNSFAGGGLEAGSVALYLGQNWQGGAVIQGGFGFTTSYGGPRANSVQIIGDEPIVVAAPPSPAPTCTMSFSPSTVGPNEPSTFSWSSANASSITSSVWGKLNGTSGTIPNAKSGQTLTLQGTSSGPGGTGTCSATLTVSANPPPTCSVSFSASTVAPGQPFTYTWSSANATSLTLTTLLNGGSMPVLGPGPVGISGTNTMSWNQGGTYSYYFNASGQGGAADCAGSILVTTASAAASDRNANLASVLTALESVLKTLLAQFSN